jgi:hypothetical protein
MSKCANGSKDSTQNSSSPIRLTIRGLGHVVSFKNNKVIGKGRLFTKPSYREWMRKCTDSFALQFICAYRTTERGMPMARSLPSWTACVAPYNDSVRNIPEQHVYVEIVPNGEEGADILIERLE